MDGEHGLGVVALAEGLPDPGALLEAVRLLRGEQGERGLHLAASAAAEQAADHGGEGDQVGDLEGLYLTGVGDRVDVAGEHVLSGEVAAVLGLDAVGVDPVDVRLRVLHRQAAAITLGGADPVHLGLEVGLGVRGLRPELLLQALVGKGSAGERGQVAAADVAEEVHLPEPVLCGGEARAEGSAVAGGALDVGDAGLLVAGDGDVGTRAGGRLDLVGGDAEGGVVEEVVDLGVGEPGVAGDQRVVAGQLVGGVGGHRAERLVQEDLGEGRVAVLAGRQDVRAPASAVVGDGQRDGVGGRRGGRGRERGEQGRAEGDHPGGDGSSQASGGTSHTCSSVGQEAVTGEGTGGSTTQ